MLEEDLDDDRAKFKRQVTRLVDSGYMTISGPIRIEDIMRKNEVNHDFMCGHKTYTIILQFTFLDIVDRK